MTLQNYPVVLVLMGSAAMAHCAIESGPSLHDQDESDAEMREVASSASALVGNTSACLDLDVGRWEVTYSSGYIADMEVPISDLPPDQQDWANRTDCAAMIVDWRREPDEGKHNDAAFINGIVDPAFIQDFDAEACSQLHTSKKIVSHMVENEEGSWDTIADSSKVGCGWQPVWFASNYQSVKSPADWFSLHNPVRVIMQSWMYAFPVPPKVYMETDNTSDGEPCPFVRECCYNGKPLTECPT